jgi:hypothetical protein
VALKHDLRVRRSFGPWHPARLIVAGFVLAVLVGAVMLTLPVASATGGDH